MNHTTLRPLAAIGSIALAAALTSSAFAQVEGEKPSPAGPATPARDSKTQDVSKILERIGTAIGDESALSKLGRLKFHLVIEAGGKVSAARTVQLDLARSLLRVDLPVKKGEVVCALSLKGKPDAFKVQQGGADVDPKDSTAIVKKVSDTFASDWNYLSLAHRLKSPDYLVKYDGEIEVEKTMCDRLVITASDEKKAATADRYWLVVERASGMPKSLLVKWRSMDESQKPLRFDYGEWKTIGGVKLPARLNGVGNPQVLKFDELTSPEKFAEDVFLGVK